MSILITTSYFRKGRSFAYNFCSAKNYKSPAHSHSFHEYFIVTSGNALHICNDDAAVIEKGDLYFIRKDDVHSYSTIKDNDCEWINVAFTENHLDSLFEYLQIPKNKILREDIKDKKPAVIKLSSYQLKELISEHEYLNFISDNDFEVGLHFKNLLQKVIGMFLMQLKKTAEKHDYSNFFKIINDIDNLKLLREGVPALVRLSGLSHGHLCKVMKDTLGTTPTKHINDLRLKYASNLILNSDLNMLDIADRVGYQSYKHFTALFKEKYNCSPNRYRKSN
ncbi:MAG: AraC family transcriptional regulator [Oscillospiraceae bacterium]|nr:AraC family transcriptional regulator [Oscillospiraceae bacterium]